MRHDPLCPVSRTAGKSVCECRPTAVSARPLTREERALLGSAPDLIDPHRLVEALVAAEAEVSRLRAELDRANGYGYKMEGKR